MNALKNKVKLIGRLGVEPELVKFETGRTLARFTLATNENYKDKKGEWHELTQWHTINAWGKLADLILTLPDCWYLHKTEELQKQLLASRALLKKNI